MVVTYRLTLLVATSNMHFGILLTDYATDHDRFVLSRTLSKTTSWR